MIPFDVLAQNNSEQTRISENEIIGRNYIQAGKPRYEPLKVYSVLTKNCSQSRHRYPQQTCKALVSKVHTMHFSKNEVQRRADTRSGSEEWKASKWKNAMDSETSAFSEIDWWDIVDKPQDKRILQKDLFLKHYEDRPYIASKYSARFVVCWDEKTMYVDNCSLVVNFKIVNLVIYITKQRHLVSRHLNFQDAFRTES